MQPMQVTPKRWNVQHRAMQGSWLTSSFSAAQV